MVFIAVLGSAISIAYYLRLIMMMFFPKESSFKTSERVPLTYNIVAVFIIVALLAMGIFPDLFAKQFGL